MTTVISRKWSLENKHLRHYDYFVVILAKYAINGRTERNTIDINSETKNYLCSLTLSSKPQIW